MATIWSFNNVVGDSCSEAGGEFANHIVLGDICVSLVSIVNHNPHKGFISLLDWLNEGPSCPSWSRLESGRQRIVCRDLHHSATITAGRKPKMRGLTGHNPYQPLFTGPIAHTYTLKSLPKTEKDVLS